MASKISTGEFLSPWAVLMNQVKKIFSSISYVVKNPLKILPTVFVAMVWIVIAVFNHLDKFPNLTSTLSAVSFAKAGGSNFYAAVLGKSIFASAFSILVLSVFSKSGKNKGVSFGKKMRLSLGFPFRHIGKYLVGSGIAGGLFVFLSGNVSKEMIAGGLACAYLSARAAIGEGFWKQFFGGFFRKRRGYHEFEGMTAFYAGMTVGFLAASGIGIFENNTLLLIIAAVLSGVGLVLQILIWLNILKIGGGKNIQKAAAILILLTLFMPYLSYTAFANQGAPFAPDKFPDSKYIIEIRENYEAAVEPEKLKAENLLFKEFFTITVQDKESLEEVYRQDFSVSAPAPKDYYSIVEKWKAEEFIMVNSNHVWAEWKPKEGLDINITLTFDSEINNSINLMKEKYEVEEVDNRAEKPIEITQKEDFFKIQGTSELRNESLNSKREYNALLSRIYEIVQMKKMKEIPNMVFSQYVYVGLVSVDNYDDKSKPFAFFDYEKWDKMERVINETLEVPYVIQWGEASGTDAVTQKVTQDADIVEGT